MEKGIAPHFLDESLAKQKLSITPRPSILSSILSIGFVACSRLGESFGKVQLGAYSVRNGSGIF